MTKTARKSLNKKLILVLLAALLVLVIAMQVVYAPVYIPTTTGNSVYADDMNGVSVKYTPSENGLVENSYALTDSNVAASATNKITYAPSKQVDVIISLDGTPMMQYAADNGITVAEALSTYEGNKNLDNLHYIRDLALNEIDKYIIERRYDYTTVINAFSATVKYGDIEAIESNRYVQNVIISETYLEPEAVTENYVDVYGTGIFNSEGIGYDGTGTVVAVVDTGTDYTHEVFNMELNADTLAITKDDVARVAASLTATSLSAGEGETINEDNLYISSKLPFGYDYADSDANVYPHESHGTHVAGIIAGKSQTITGVAPGAQIATFKVFSDYTSGARTEWILAGLNDAVTLGVDAINMSLGTSCGFSREVDEYVINRVYDSINAAGICLVVAASNDASSANGSTWGNTNLSSNPDSGTLGSPGSYNAALSVGSVSGVKTKYFIVNGEEVYFAESRLVGKTDANDFVGGLLGDKTEGEFEYVVIPGVGLPINYSELDVTGKIAVVKRGTNSFEEKVRVAYTRGAIGVIVYNNVSGTISMSVGTSELIPSCFVTMDLAENMVAAGSGKLKLSTSYLAGPFMSDFSSWGCLPNLILAPDITAHGGEIYSSVPGGDKYDTLSGTSMAAPNLAGALILVREYVKETREGYSTTEVRDESYSRMMSTATIVKNEQGNPYSPRKQGAGIANIANSINTKAYLTVDGSNKPKLSLGDDPDRAGVYELKFNLVNSSASAISYNLDQYVMTESISSDDRTVAEKAYMFEDTVNTYSIQNIKRTSTLNGNTISVPGYGEVAITVKIALSAADKQYLDNLFINGMFVEGYVMLKSNTTDGIDLNIPYLAFYGDWSDAPMLDVSAYEVGESAVDDSILAEDKLQPDVYGTLPYFAFYSPYGSDNLGYYGMGAFAYNVASGYATPVTQEKYAALTTNSDGAYMFYGISAGLLRCAKRVEMEIRNSATGELIWSGTDYNARKTYGSGGEQVGGMVNVELDIRKLNLPNNSKYTFSMTCYLDWKKDNSYISDYSDQMDHMDEYIYGNRNTFSFEFTVDNEAPTLTKAAVRKQKTDLGTYQYGLELNLHDNHYMQGYSVYTYEDKEFVSGYERLVGTTAITDGVIPIDGELNADNLSSINISGYWNRIMENGGKLYITLYDYALNSSSYEIVISENGDSSVNPGANMVSSPKEDLTIAKNRNVRDDYTIKVNEQLDLADLLTVKANINEGTNETPVYQEGYWMKDLVWENSDPSIVDITQQGVVTALKEGQAVITVHTPNVSSYDEDDVDHCLKFIIIVSGTQAGGVKISGVDLSATSLTLETGESVTISATIKPYNYVGDFQLEWSPQNSKTVQITVSEDGMSIELLALKSGDVRIQANVVGTYYSGYCNVSVQTEFVVANNVYLRSYNGRGSDWVNENGEVEHNVVDIPYDLGVAYIYPSAFYGNEYIKKVIIPEGITSIMRGAFFNCTALEEVVLPESLTTIEYLAFANCENLKIINLGKVASIGDSSFWGCVSLEQIDLSSCTYIDAYAFANCTGLTSLDLSRVGIIGGGAFFRCLGLETLVIPENTSMGYDTTYLESSGFDRGGAFSYCMNLRTVIIKSNSVGKHAFMYCIGLENVIFENDVNVIEEMAFALCINLKNVTFYGTVYEIDDYAFALSGLNSITLPDGLTVLGYHVFEGCDDLTSVHISSGALLDTVGSLSLAGSNISEFVVENGNKYLSTVDGVLYDKAQKKLIAYPDYRPSDGTFVVPDSVITIGESAFAGVHSVFNIDLNNVQYIEANAFSNMIGYYTDDDGSQWVAYTQFINYDNVKYIGDSAFMGSTLYTLPISNEKTTYIGDYAFYSVMYHPNNNALTSFTAPKNLTYLGDYAFAGRIVVSGENILNAVPMFTTVSFAGSSITKVGIGAFYCNPELQTVNFGNLVEISDYMFASSIDYYKASGLKSIVIPNTVKSIGNSAFEDCTLLSSVTLPSQLKYIADSAFRNTALTSITLPDSVETIGNRAFENSKLTSIDLNNVTSIGNYAFARTLISEVTSESVKSIGTGAFSNCENLTKAVLSSTQVVGAGAFAYCDRLSTIDFAVATNIGSDAFNGCASLTEIDLPKAQYIGARAFYGAENVISVALPEVVEIGADAFNGTAITSIELPATLAKLENKAFYGANSLKTITVDDNNKTYVDMDGGVLYSVNDVGMYTLVCYPAGKNDVTAYDVYSHTIKLGAYAFSANKTLESITLPAYMQVIGMSAMSGMTNLSTLYINAVSAPTLESDAYMVYTEFPDLDDSTLEGDDDGGYIGDSDFDNENEFIYSDDGVFTNFYDNFSVAFDDENKSDKLTIYIPYNNIGYDSYTWKLYVGECLVVTDKIHATLGTLELIDSIQDELNKPTHNASDVKSLVSMCNIITTAQRQIILGNYDYEENDADGNVVTIDKEYYNKMFGGTDFYALLTQLQSKSASASALNAESGYALSAATTVDVYTAIAVTALNMCIVLIIVSAITDKRRSGK